MKSRQALTETACPRCLRLACEGKIREETVQRLPAGVAAPLARDGSGKCCFDCASADTIAHLYNMSFCVARVTVANERQEQYRLPGVRMGLVKEGLVRASLPDDLKSQHEWLARRGLKIKEQIRRQEEKVRRLETQISTLMSRRVDEEEKLAELYKQRPADLLPASDLR